jgi:hypothetical protein
MDFFPNARFYFPEEGLEKTEINLMLNICCDCVLKRQFSNSTHSGLGNSRMSYHHTPHWHVGLIELIPRHGGQAPWESK